MVPREVKKALQIAYTWPYGPVAIEVPVDNLNRRDLNMETVKQWGNYSPNEPVLKSMPGGSPEEIEKACEILLKSKRPTILAGDGLYYSCAEEEIKDLQGQIQSLSDRQMQNLYRGPVAPGSTFSEQSSRPSIPGELTGADTVPQDSSADEQARDLLQDALKEKEEILASARDEANRILSRSKSLAAKEAGLDGKYRIALLNTTGQPYEAVLSQRALRERLHRASVARGSRGNAFDTTRLVARTVALRQERAELLGYVDRASFQIEEGTAKTPAAAIAMLRQLAPASVASARREAAELQALIDRDQAAQGARQGVFFDLIQQIFTPEDDAGLRSSH